MKRFVSRVLFLILPFICLGFAESSDDKFIKRYALMKLYETCFGPEVVKEVRKEMKLATAKCSGSMPVASMPIASMYSSSATSNILKVAPPLGAILQPNKQSTDAPFSNEHLKSQISSSIDLNKLQQAILAGYNKQIAQQAQYQNGGGIPNLMGYSQYPRPWNGYSSNGGPSFYPPQNGGLLTPQSSGPGYLSPPMNHPVNPFYQSSYFSPFFQNGRITRDLDVRGQLESLAVKISGRVKNVTCIMQELGYLNENMEPDYTQMIDRIKRLPIAEDLKQDMTEGVEYCKQFSLCVPDEGKEKFAKEMVKPMFFFRCYKHKKMEACILKDIRERYSSEEPDENLVGIDRSVRSKDGFSNDDAMELALYEFLYGSETADTDLLI